MAGTAFVVAAFVRPQIFHQMIFSHKLPSPRLTNKNFDNPNADIVNQANHAVVTIIATRAVQSSQVTPSPDWSLPQDNNVQRGTGTGFIIDSEGLIVTNEHVIKDADRIRIKLADGQERKASVRGVDRATDLALLKIDATNLNVLTLGDSDEVRVGDPVIAIGNPLEYEHSATAGIVSAKGRKVYGLSTAPFEDFIQTDAAINRGNSGGPLINRAGEVIGVNTVIRVDGRGISFAVPSNVVKHVVAQLRLVGFVSRGYLGLTPSNINSEIRDGLGLGNVQGVLVADVAPDFPAARTGIQPYDVITHFNRRAVRHIDDFFVSVANTLPQQKVELDILRGGQPLKFFPTLESRPDNEGSRPLEVKPAVQKTGSVLGFTVRENSPDTLRDLRIGKLTESVTGGVIISEIDPLGSAADSHLTVGHIILEANRTPIRKLEDFQKVISHLREGSALVLRVSSPYQRGFSVVAIRVGEK